MARRKLVALDFDGVLFDSAPECFVVALRTFRELHPESSLGQGSKLAQGELVGAAERVPADPLYADFLGMMALGNRAEDFGVELRALEKGRVLADQSEYDEFKATLGDAWLQRFHEQFYRVRTALSEREPDDWLRLTGAYPGIPELLRRRAGELVLAIATAKDHRSVRKLLSSSGMADVFPDEFVLDKETGADKRSHLELLRRRTGFAYEEMLFVDDKVNHLDRVSQLGVRCGLATWGYNAEREMSQARDRGHIILELDRLDSQLFDGVGSDGRDPSI